MNELWEKKRKSTTDGEGIARKKEKAAGKRRRGTPLESHPIRAYPSD